MKISNTPDAVFEVATTNSIDDLTQTVRVLEWIERNKLSDGVDVDHNIRVLRDAIKAKAKAAVYAFYKYDGLWEAMDECWEDEGISLMKRYWDKVQYLLWTDRPGTIKSAVKILQREWITRIYTWCIYWEFCWIQASIQSEEDEYTPWEIVYSELKDEQIEALREAWIDVIILNKLI